MDRSWQSVGSGDEKEGREGDDGTGSLMGWLEEGLGEGAQNGVHGEKCRAKEERLHLTWSQPFQEDRSIRGWRLRPES